MDVELDSDSEDAAICLSMEFSQGFGCMYKFWGASSAPIGLRSERVPGSYEEFPHHHRHYISNMA